MKMMICLHGNPLQGQEFEHLMPSFNGLGIMPVIHKRPLKGAKFEPLLQSISATAKVSGNGPFFLLGYSWGAYLALAYLQRFPENVAGALLINPLLVQTLNAETKGIKTPSLFKSLSFRYKCNQLACTFIEKSFTPSEPQPEIKERLEKELSHALTWEGEAAYQKMMLERPLLSRSEPSSVPLRILVGEQDSLAPFESQASLLNAYSSCTLTKIPDAGHAIPWTHSEFILQELNQLQETH